MANNEFLKWTTSDVDFYALLGLTSESCTESEVQRAYRKTALKYHPDKLGKDFDPEKYEQFQAANEVLKDAALKAKYDAHRQAKLQRQRANDLFEGKRRQMKEDLEARERGGTPSGGVKRSREEDERQAEMIKLAEKGRAARAARATKLAEAVASSPAPPPPQPKCELPKEQATPSKDHKQSPDQEEDEIERLERMIREAEAAKVKRKAAKRARKSGVFVPFGSPAMAESGPEMADRDTHTPIKRPDIFRGLKADDKSSASPKFSFSPSIPTPKRNDFAATMARLKAAEKQRLEEEIKQGESETA